MGLPLGHLACPFSVRGDDTKTCAYLYSFLNIIRILILYQVTMCACRMAYK